MKHARSSHPALLGTLLILLSACAALPPETRQAAPAAAPAATGIDAQIAELQRQRRQVFFAARLLSDDPSRLRPADRRAAIARARALDAQIASLRATRAAQTTP